MNIYKISICPIKFFLCLVIISIKVIAGDSLDIIENLLDSPDKYENKKVVLEGFAASPECYQIESGGCSGTPCIGDLVLQTELLGGPSVILSGNFNGIKTVAESDGCILNGTPLTIRWQYRVWGVFHKLQVEQNSNASVVTIDSFKLMSKEPDQSEFSNSSSAPLSITEGAGREKTVYTFDSTNISGKWSLLKSDDFRINIDDPLDTVYKGTFSGALTNSVWNGPWIQYFSNGKIRAKGEYYFGAKQGAWAEWDSSGRLLSEGQFNKGHESGIWKKRIRENGPFTIYDYSTKDKIDITSFTPDSQKEYIVVLNKNLENIEKFESFYPGGVKKRQITIDPSNKNATTEEWLPSGVLSGKQIYTNGTFIDTLWYDSKTIWKTRNRSIDNDSAVFTEYYEDGKKKWTGNFAGFKPHGEWTNTDKDGNKLTKIRFRNGLLNDTSFYYDSGNHSVISTEVYSNGKLLIINNKNVLKKTVLDKDGKLSKQADVSSLWTDYTNFTFIRSIKINGNQVWVGTNGGVECFSENGTSLGTITTGDGLPGNRITALNIDKNNHIWFGTEQGIFYNSEGAGACCITINGKPLVKLLDENGLIGGVVSNTQDSTIVNSNKENTWNAIAALTENGWEYHDSTGENEFNTPVVDIAVGADTKVWYCGINGLKLIGSKLSPSVRSRLILNCSQIETASDSSVWVISFDTLFHLKNDSLHAYRPADFVNSGELISLHYGFDKSLYVLTSNKILKFLNGKFVSTNTFKNYQVIPRTKFLIERDGSFVFATDKGLIKLNKKNIKVLVSSQKLNNEQITCFAKESLQYWVGTKNGLFKINASGVIPVKSKKGIPAENISFVRAGRTGIIWAYAKGAFLSYYDQQKWNSFKASNQLDNNLIQSIVTADDSSIFTGTEKGLYQVYKDHLIDYSKNEKNAKGSITSIVKYGNSGICYVLDRYKVVRFDGKRFETIYNQIPNIDGIIQTIMVDNTGYLWISDQNGISIVDNYKKIRTFSVSDGLPILPIVHFYTSKKGEVFAATVQAVYQLKGKYWSSIFTEDNLNGSEITSLAEDKNGTLWIGTKNGVVKFFNNRVEFDTMDGILDHRINDIFSSKDGIMWIATEKGLCSYKQKSGE